jgi:hypothetical protein
MSWLVWNHDLQISAFQVAGIIGMSQHTKLLLFFVVIIVKDFQISVLPKLWSPFYICLGKEYTINIVFIIATKRYLYHPTFFCNIFIKLKEVSHFDQKILRN